MRKNILFYICLICVFVLSACKETEELFVEVNFEANNNTQAETIIYSNQSFGLMPNDPVKDGHIFDGWYRDQGLTEPFDLKTIDFNAADFAVFAKWISIENRLSFETNSNNTVGSILLDIGSPIVVPTGLSKNGYHLYGWYLDEGLTTPLESFVMPDHDLTLYARWTDSIFYYEIEDNQAIITGIIPEEIDNWLVVPETIDGYPVISLTYDALEGYDEIYLIDLPSSIEYLPLGVFHDQINLQSLETPFLGIGRYQDENQSEIYNYLLGSMFVKQENQLFISDDPITTYQSYIPYNMRFLHITDSEIIPSHSLSYTNLDNVYFGETTTTIQAFAFNHANGNSTVNISESIEIIEPGAFANMNYLYDFFVNSSNQHFSTNDKSNMLLSKDQTKLIAYGNANNPLLVEIPSTITSISSYAFANSSIFKITIPESVVTIDEYAFYNSKRLTEVIFEENSQLTTIGAYAFSNTSLISITIPNQVTQISNDAFANNHSLQTLIFEPGNQLSNIGYRAFENTYSLTSVILPLSIEFLGPDVFSGNLDLIVYVEAESKPSGWSPIWADQILEENIIWGYTN